jgi:hypothetical protein
MRYDWCGAYDDIEIDLYQATRWDLANMKCYSPLTLFGTPYIDGRPYDLMAMT